MAIPRILAIKIDTQPVVTTTNPRIMAIKIDNESIVTIKYPRITAIKIDNDKQYINNLYAGRLYKGKI